MSSTSEPSGRRWQRRGVQARSHRTQDAILDAAERLFARQGVEATSVTEVAVESGRSIGALYHHFENKETLVAAVVDRLTDRLEANIETAIDPGRWRGLAIADVVRVYLETSLALGVDRPGGKRITVEVSLVDPATRARYRMLRRRLDEGLVALLLARRDEIGHPDPETAAGFVVDQLGAMLSARLDPDLAPSRLEVAPDSVFVEESVESVRTYLRLMG